MPDFIPVFTSSEGKAEVMCAYQAVMDQWPVPYEELTIPTSFGETHVIASGPQERAPDCIVARLAGDSDVVVSKCRNLEPVLPGVCRRYCRRGK